MSASLSVGTGQQVIAQPSAIIVNPQPMMGMQPPPPMPVIVPDPNRPWPPVLETPIGQTVCNYISYCRNYHTAGFGLYIILLIFVIAAVWVGKNGSWSLFNVSVAVTVIIAVLIALMFIHWYWFIKGVIPSCEMGTFNVSGSITASAGARASATPTYIAATTATPAVVQQTTTTTTTATTSAAPPVGTVGTAAAVGVGTEGVALSGGSSHGNYYYQEQPPF